jgi:hypothetical protein
MLSGHFLEINQNKRRTAKTDGYISRLLLVGLLAATGFIHWYLPVVHRIEMPGELTGEIIVIHHSLLHLLFDLNGSGYFVLVALITGWLPLWANQPKRLYGLVAGYATVTILAWLLLSDPAERTILDYSDKIIELIIVALAVSMIRQLAMKIRN